MAFCSKCGSEVPEGTAFCPSCGAQVGAGVSASVMVPEWDHTAEFTPEDVSNGKLFAMLSYLTGLLGIVLTYLGAKDSAYAMFHAKEALKINVCMILVGLASGLLSWTCIVPIAGGIAICILTVLCFIGFFSVCKGNAKELPILRGMAFLK